MARILIVDDEEMDRVLMRSLLEPGEHHLMFAADGQAAYDLCHETDVDVMITDLAMPGLNGLRLIRELREDNFDIPIIAISCWAADQLDMAEDFGANFTLYKPLDGAKFLDAVQAALLPRRVPFPTELFR